MAKAAIAGDHQNLRVATGFIQRRTNLRHALDETRREVEALAPVRYCSQACGSARLPGFLTVETSSKRMGMARAENSPPAVQRQQQRSRQETQAQDQIRVKRR